MPSVRVARSLDLTNDFRGTFDSATTLGALLWSIDDNDYVDRRSVTAGLTRRIGGRRTASLRVEAGVANDRGLPALLERGLFRPDSGFRVNRGVDPGTYVRASAMLQLHPDVNAEFVRPGVGAILRYDRGDGDLDWQRVEARLVARRNVRSMTYAFRIDAGALSSDDPPPQQLFELGWSQGLPGYRYKEFAGDRAVLARARAVYHLAVLRAPIRVWRQLYLPGLAPGLFGGIHTGWTDASSSSTVQSITRLGTTTPVSGIPISHTTNGIRSSVELGLEFFGGGLAIAVGRPLDHQRSWRVTLGAGGF
jgi:hypothetical protein